MNNKKTIYKILISTLLCLLCIFSFQKSVNAQKIPINTTKVMACANHYTLGSAYHSQECDSKAPEKMTINQAGMTAAGCPYTYTEEELKMPLVVINCNGNGNKSDTHCIESKYLAGHGDQNNSWPGQYKVEYRVEFEGGKASFYKDNGSSKTKTVENRTNAIMYALCSMNQSDNTYPINGFIYNYAPKQIGIWAFANEFVSKNNLGIGAGSIDFGIQTQQIKNIRDNVLAQAKETADNIMSNSGKSADISVYSNSYNSPKADLQTINGVQYQKVGPFRYTITGNITSVSVTNQDGSSINFKTYTNGTVYNGSEGIQNGKEFYILLTPNSNNKKMNLKINVSLTKLTGKITMWILTKSQSQNIITLDNQTSTTNTFDSISKTVDLFAEIHMVKKGDLPTSGNALPGVKFKIGLYKDGKQQYLTFGTSLTNGLSTNYKSSGAVKPSYTTNINYAYEFTTNNSGKIDVYLVDISTDYFFVETYNPNYGYPEKPNATFSRKATQGLGTISYPLDIFTNNRTKTDLLIRKVDSNNSSIVLPGVKFRVYTYQGGSKKYIRYGSGEISESPSTSSTVQEPSFTSASSAQVFVTDSNGYIKLRMLPLGTYYFEEITNPCYGYEDIELSGDGVIDKKTIKITAKGDEVSLTGTYDKSYKTKYIKNVKKYTRIQITKQDLYKSSWTLPGVKFKVYNKSTGKYIYFNENLPTKSSNRSGNTWIEPKYGTASQAYVFETDSNGKINIDHVLIGEYVFVEQENKNYGYEDMELYNGFGTGKRSVTVQGNANQSDVYGAYKGSPQAIKNIRHYTDIFIQKVNTDDTSFTLDGVKFKVKNVKTGQYIKFNGMPAGLSSNMKSNGTWYEPIYTYNINEAYEFVSDSNGRVRVSHVKISTGVSEYSGEYKFIETYNPHYGYDTNPQFDNIKLKGDEVDNNHVQLTKTNLLKNKQIWVKLSGYVWEDIASGKATVRDDVYTSGSSDKLIDYAETAVAESDEHIWVRLKDINTGKIVQHYDIDHAICSGGAIAKRGLDLGPQEMTTGSPYGTGRYMFWEVEIKELDHYMVEFQYDGLIYSYVVPKTSIANGSKAAENSKEREAFNAQFGKVYHGVSDTTYTGRTDNLSGSSGVTLKYKADGSQRTVLDPARNYFKIFANTKETSLNLRKKFSWGMEEIPNINLGLYRRDQPDLALTKSVQDARLIINGYEHVYAYNKTNVTNNNTYSTDVGIKFKNERNSRYTQPIYRADATRKYDNENSKELRVYITYKIEVKNESSTLTNKVYQINDYLSSWFEVNDLTIAGYKYNVDGKSYAISQKISYTTKNSGSNKILQIPVNLEIDPGKSAEIYVQVCVSRQRIKEICDTNESGGLAELANYAEIASYATYKNNKIYAGVDQDSAPGNFNLNNIDGTYEDDTAKAQGIRFVYGDNDTEGREITGNVFEDLALPGYKGESCKEELLGDGIFNSGETGIEGVKVVLKYAENSKDNMKDDPAYLVVKNSSGTYYETNSQAVDFMTDSNGNYTIHGFTPDKYYVEFTWGDEKYTGPLKSTEDDTKAKYEKYSPFYFKSTIAPKFKTYTTNEGWHQTTTPRYNDAKDTEQTIEEIRNKVGNDFVYENTIALRNNTENVTAKSITPNFSVGIEQTDVSKGNNNYTSTVDVANENPKAVYRIENIDLGLIEKGQTRLIIKKLVDEYKVTLANGTVFATGVRDKTSDNFLGDNKYIIYVNQTVDKDDHKGELMIQIDPDIMLNTTLEVKYSFRVFNNSTKVYDSLDYYWYGTKGSAPLQKVYASSIVDYMDLKWSYEDKSAEAWESISTTDLIEKVTIGGSKFERIAKAVKDSDTFKTLNKLIIDKDLGKTSQLFTPLAPGEEKTIYSDMNSLFTTKDNLLYINSTNILKVSRDEATTSTIPITPPERNPGEYIPDSPTKFYQDGDLGYPAQEINIIPPTGSGFDLRSWVIVSIIALGVLGIGIVIILKVNKTE